MSRDSCQRCPGIRHCRGHKLNASSEGILYSELSMAVRYLCYAQPSLASAYRHFNSDGSASP